MPNNILIYSGGLDSTVLLWKLAPDVKCLLFDYDQRHITELAYAQQNCVSLGVDWQIVDLRAINYLIRKGSQAGGDPPPDGHYAEESMKTTIVPNRNMIMLAIAVGHAVTIGAGSVYFAAHGGDHAIYPDCRPSFVEALKQAVLVGNEWTPVDIVAPFLSLQKADIVKLGHDLGIPFEHTWSCYKGLDKHCGTCGTCVERREAFQLAGVVDPTKYQSPVLR